MPGQTHGIVHSLQSYAVTECVLKYSAVVNSLYAKQVLAQQLFN